MRGEPSIAAAGPQGEKDELVVGRCGFVTNYVHPELCGVERCNNSSWLRKRSLDSDVSDHRL